MLHPVEIHKQNFAPWPFPSLCMQQIESLHPFSTRSLLVYCHKLMKLASKKLVSEALKWVVYILKIVPRTLTDCANTTRKTDLHGKHPMEGASYSHCNMRKRYEHQYGDMINGTS
jgi:hypothetical protein